MTKIPLGDISPVSFLKEYWQKKPLFIANAFPEFSSADYSPIIDPDELAGLACEEDVESRLILEKHGKHPWELRHGPFTESDLEQLPETHWSLLIQECNKHVPELSQLLELFNFIPNWRIDDVMVSCAPEHGSVGPHTDQYDVFLIQGLGRRRWQINSHLGDDARVIPDIDLKILETPKDGHEWDQEWIAEPGDMLYLPPGVAHFGVALEDCITMSVGFRAASHFEILSDYVDYTGEHQATNKNSEQQRYSDPDLELQAHPGEITQQSINQVESILRDALTDKDGIKHWLGQFATTPKNEVPDLSIEQQLEPADLLEQLKSGNTLVRSEYSRFAFIEFNEQETSLFIDGEETSLTENNAALAPLLCDQRELRYRDIKDHLPNNPLESELIQLLASLTNSGKLYFVYDE